MKSFFTIAFFLTVKSVIGQGEANNWYFGNNAAVTFNSGSPVAVTGSMLNTFEGCSSISDSAGNLLFYTEGIHVWNRNNQLMSNGSGLMGNSDATQAAVIVRQPGSYTLFYIFTVPNEATVNGFRYSIVDMTLNGGFGNVTSKNVLIFTPSSEKITAVKHSNGFDIWVLTHDWNSNAFRGYLLTSSGLNMTPVISNTGLVHTGSTWNTNGYMKASPLGNKIGVAICHYMNKFEVLDFDKSTGIVSNPITFPTYPAGIGAYGIEFSPDGTKMYGSLISSPTIYQFDLNAGSAAAVINSATIIGTDGSWTSALQLGPDGKIYVVRNGQTYLGVINFPNITGVGCNYVSQGVSLGSHTGSLGLPNILVDYFNPTFSYNKSCFGDTTFFTISNSATMLGATWNFGDPSSGVNNASTFFNPGHLFTAPGTYNVQLIKYYLFSTDTNVTTITIDSLPICNLGPDTVFCSGTSILLSPGNGYLSYLWQNGSTVASLNISTSGTYTVTVSNGSCTASDAVIVNQVPCNLPVVSLYSSDTVFCGNSCIDFYDISTNNPTSWQWFFQGAVTATSNLQNPTNICYNNSGSFDVTLIACNNAGCDTVVMTGFINSYSLPIVNIIQSQDTLIAPTGFSYQWFSVSSGVIAGATSNYLVPSSVGDYYVVVMNSFGCSATSNIITITAITPSVNIMSSDSNFCEKHCIDFYDLSTNNPTSWQWFFPGADSLASSLQNPTNICYNNYGSFDVTLIACNAAGCDTVVMPAFINEFQTPIPVIYQSNDTLFSSPGTSYQWWSIDSGAIAGATNSYFSVPAYGGNYYVIVADSFGCEGVSNVISITAMNDMLMGNAYITITPNPNNGIFQLEFNGKSGFDKTDMEIINVLGETIFAKHLENKIERFPVVINLSGFEKGIYVCKIVSDKKIISKKIIIY